MASWRGVTLAALVLAATATAGHPGAGTPTAQAATPAAQARPGTQPLSKGDVLSPRLATLTVAGFTTAAADRMALPVQGPGSLLRSARDAVLTEVRVSSTESAQLTALSAAGAEVRHVAELARVVTAAVPVDRLRAVADVAGVRSVTEVLTPLTARAPAGPGRAAVAAPPCGSVRSEGDEHLRAAAARAAFGVEGAGVKVGVLSDSYDRRSGDRTDAADDVASGDVPGGGSACGRAAEVQVLSEPPTTAMTNDEGRAMLQHVHDLAPASELAFATGAEGLEPFADSVRALRAAGAEVILDDISYLIEPMYQDGPVGVAYGAVRSSGASTFTAVGNDNVIVAGRDVGSYETAGFRTVSCPDAVATIFGTACHDFDPGPAADPTYALTLGPGGRTIIDLQWAQPWEGVRTDLDLVVLDASGAPVDASFADNVVSQRPFEAVELTNTTAVDQVFQLAVVNFTGPPPRFKFVQLDAEGLRAVEYDRAAGGDMVGPTVFGHAASPNVFSTAAVRFDSMTTPEQFSSRGPAEFLFGPTGGATAAPPLAQPLRLVKPDAAATDGAQTTFFPGCLPATTTPCRFFGTSAAAPHAAAVAALVLERAPGTTPDAVDALLRTTARPLLGGSPQSRGTGLLDAEAAVASAGELPPPVIPESPAVLLLPLVALAAGGLLVRRRCRGEPGADPVMAATRPTA